MVNVDEKIKIAMAKGNQMNIRMEIGEMSFREFGKFCSKPQKGGKHEAYFIRGVPEFEETHTTRSGVVYNNGYFRHNSSLLSSDFLIIDADNSGPGPKEVHKCLTEANLTHFIYTTHSHSGEKNNFRAVLPCKCDDKMEMKQTAIQIIKDLNERGVDVKYTIEMGVWSQAWYLPTRDDPDDGIFEYYEYMDGEEYEKIESGFHRDTDNSDNSGSDVNKNVGIYSGKTIHDLINTIVTGSEGLHHAIRDYSHTLTMDGIPKETVVQTIKGLMYGIRDRDSRIQERYKDIDRIVEEPNDNFGTIDFGDQEAKVVDGTREDAGTSKVGGKRKNVKLSSKSDEDLDKPLDWPPGMMGELARCVYDFSPYPNRMISIVTALGLVAGVAGRRFNIYGSGLNVYITLLMDTGGGKSVISKFINRILNDANIFTGANVFTGSGRYTGPKALMDDLNNKRCMVSVFTEAGFMFKSKSGDQDGLTRSILDLYGSSGYGCVSSGGAYSSDKNNIPAVCSPCFSMVNESTPDVFLEALKDGSKTGEINRMNIFRVDVEDHRINRNAVFDIPNDLLVKIKDLMGRCTKTQHSDDPDVTNFIVTDEMYAFADEMKKNALECKFDDPIRSSMLQRSAEKCFKVACLITVLNGRGDKGVRELNVLPEAWEWAKELHVQEMRGLEDFFRVEGESNIYYIIVEHVYPVIVKMLTAKYADKMLQPTIVDRKRNRFPLSMLRRALKNCRVINNLGNIKNGKDGIDILITYMQNNGFIKLITAGARNSQYVVVKESLLDIVE